MKYLPLVQVLVTNAVSVDQWVYQFKLWTTIQDENIGRFTSSNKNWFTADAGVMVCTYSMIAGTFKRAADSQKVFDAIVGREWGLILLDEVHVVPAEMFRCVLFHHCNNRCPFLGFLGPSNSPGLDHNTCVIYFPSSANPYECIS